jgi:hypothetical protein
MPDRMKVNWIWWHSHCMRANKTALSRRLTMDQTALIEKQDLLKALKCYLGAESIPEFEYQVTKGTEKVQGFLSLVLRVRVSFESGSGIKDVSFVVKRLPIAEAQLRYTKGSDFYKRESDFFNIVQPILKKNFR